MDDALEGLQKPESILSRIKRALAPSSENISTETIHTEGAQRYVDSLDATTKELKLIDEELSHRQSPADLEMKSRPKNDPEISSYLHEII